MGMQVSNAPAGADDEPIMDINTTPLIDVMLVLLVMLIITIPIQLHAVNLNLPVGTPPPGEAHPEVVKIDIDNSSTIFWNGSPLAGRDELHTKLQLAAAQAEQPEVHVRPGKFSKYNSFVEVMVALKQNGLNKMGVVGSEQFIE
ncbi:MAG: biopolymer transporter ExbD [Rhizobacter sp.]